jgi:hypothetical protein
VGLHAFEKTSTDESKKSRDAAVIGSFGQRSSRQVRRLTQWRVSFERYLKFGSGHAFATERLWN